MIYIYCYDKIDEINDDIYGYFLSTLPPERKRKALRYKNRIDRILSVISYKLLCFALKKELGITDAIISSDNCGKPLISNHPKVFFNLSHCQKGCACVISDMPVGIDIQDYRSVDSTVIDHVCSKKEREMILSSLYPERCFINVWTMKEAYLKMKGFGICSDLKKTDTVSLSDKTIYREFNDYSLAIATEGEMEDARIQLDCCSEKHIRSEDLFC